MRQPPNCAGVTYLLDFGGVSVLHWFAGPWMENKSLYMNCRCWFSSSTHTARDFLIVFLPPSWGCPLDAWGKLVCPSEYLRCSLCCECFSRSLWLVVYYDVIPCRLWGLKFWLVGRWFLKHVSKLLVSLLAGGHSTGAGAELSLHVLYDFCTCSFQVFQGHLDSLAVSTIQALTAVMHKSPAAKVTVSMHRAVRSFFILFAVTPWWILLMEMSRLCSHIHAS